MILRLFRSRVVAGQEARVQQYVRDEAVARALQVPGLRSFQPALRATSSGVEFVIVTTWNRFEDVAATGRALDSPVVLPATAAMLSDSAAEHYELVIGEARSMPLHSATLRLTRILIRTGAEAEYYEAVRKWSARFLDETGLVAFSLGRRVRGRQDEVLAVQIWKDEAALRDVAGSDLGLPMGRDELSRFWAADPAIEHFDALTATDPYDDAPAILLADNERRYVHATPAAARLSGHSVARLLTMRVEDVTPASGRARVPEAWSQFVAAGSMSGSFVIERPDGTEVTVKFAAKADTPWPGSHASLLVPANNELGDDGMLSDDRELDIDAALADAGLVARYADSLSG